MRILLDCRFQKGAGPNVTTCYLLNYLIKLNTEHDFVILQHKGQQLPQYPNVQKLVVPSQNTLVEFLWVQFYLPKLLRQYAIDIYHSLKHVGPLFTRVPVLLYLREVGHFHEKGQEAFQLNLVNKIYWNYILVLGLKRATHIIGISHESKTVIIQKIGISEDKISVNYHGLDPKFKIIQDRELITEVRHRYNLPENYILCVSNLYPHKNYKTVVKMLAKLKELNKEAPKLVIVGNIKYAQADFFNLIKQLRLDKDIIFTSYVDHDDLVYIYNGAALLLYPPLLGSFGNPPLEAMACGVPVVVSDRGALPEVTDGAALVLKEPKNVEKMLEAVQQILDDEQLWQTLRQKGLERVKDFSWEASASRILELYRRIGSGETHRSGN
ncbi:MAG: glycosyltransferase family 1 protein [Coleofasciculus sp. D1-CHI-01]|uniref:glycosyltransferase family 4 protein n=1 Tax=Coleofasciculus sp. D1-CHI-01 TaxID=3068482 RepID=UPI0032F7986E